ncbi:MAG: hypothetical protein IJM27_02745 [Eubacterium sp.]|nr:hypothetical protein [Eubacterium sp.]
MSRKLCVAAVLFCMMIITLTACGRADLTGDNGVEVAMFEHTFRIWKSFSEQGGESDYNKTYGDGKGQAIVAYAATANHAGIEANMDHMLPMLAEECGISRQKMETEPAELDGHEESVLFIWNYTVKGVDATACGIAIKDADSMLYIVETSDGGKKDTLKEEVLAIANTVKYTGTYQTTKKENYPYRVENGDFAVNVTEGYECIHTDGDLLNIRYTNARTYEAGSSFFQVKKLDAAGQSLQQKAEETASKLDENAEAAKAEEKKVRDIWPDAAENVAASPVWCVSSVKNQLYFEHYFLEVGGEFYYMQICYPEDDSKAAEDMRRLFYGVEFASIGLEYSGENVAGE